MSIIKNIISLTAICFGSTLPAISHAESFPQRPVTIVVPFVAGGAFDVVGRLVAEKMSANLGKQFIIENKPGAGGTLGGRQVSQARPDGYTLLLSGVGPISISPAVYKKLGYVPAKALAPVIQLTSSPFVLTTGPSFEGKSVKDLVKFLKEKPGKYNYASTGNGTLVHLAGEYFRGITKTDFEHIPYSGGSQATFALIQGDATFTITNIPNVLSQIQAGTVKGLATTGNQSSRALPDLPTMSEAGVSGFELTGWIGIFAPANTPEDIIETLNSAFVQAMNDPRIKERLQQQGDDVATGSVADFKEFVAQSDAKWKSIAEEANISIN
ncbi:hypothetical protein CAP48_07490 [Advenella sp. S44]|uniref:Bug family tripartite tricarboxylate transporter substrate binding protein n=1 Tax=Advenella sp. S44 TaxID=1982755 RepID=UPI000C2A89F6|nr:tripartite tricarboxylate transporter substrate binding protein [Advenella sp. S44]PJX25867.1 hypothetical protein CAP48_07490 [Advenella sp. S44]